MQQGGAVAFMVLPPRLPLQPDTKTQRQRFTAYFSSGEAPDISAGLKKKIGSPRHIFIKFPATKYMAIRAVGAEHAGRRI